jgi:uncharacterized protein (TIGR03437 family)
VLTLCRYREFMSTCYLPCLFWLAAQIHASGASGTATVLTVSPNPANAGAKVTLTASVTPTDATGKVTFFDGATPLGIAALSSAVASISTTLLDSGRHRLSGLYNGDALHGSSVSSAVSATVTTTPANVLAAGPVPAIPSGQTVDQLVVADLNLDGNADILVVSLSAGVSVLLGNGDGTFGTPIQTGIRTNALQVADFNGDGIPDLVYSAYSVSLGRGDGTFKPPIQSPVTGFSFSNGQFRFGVGDFNGDGKLDVVALALDQPYSTTGLILLLAGNGDGSLQAPARYPIALSTPALAAIGDFNGDGKPDLLLNSLGSSNFCVQLGKGDGTFQAAPCFSVANVISMTVADMDGDGIADLVMGRQMPNTISVLLSNGDGSFTLHAQPSQDFPDFIATGDFTGDGKADVAILSQHGGIDGVGGIAILPGNGDGTFQDAAQYTTAGPASYPSSAVIADFNHDGRLDLAIASDIGSYFSVSPFIAFSASMTGSGTGQNTSPGQPFPSNLTSAVLDDLGRPVPGVPIVFSVPLKGASATLGTGQVVIVAQTDQSGTASLPAAANSIVGTYTVSASAGFLQTSFTLTNSVDQPGSFTVVPSTVAPNTIATAYGNLPGCSQGAQVLAGGTADVFYSSDTQINFLISSAPLGGVVVQITCGSLKTGILVVPTAIAAPSIFTMDQTGAGQADVVNQDNRIGPPSPPGSIASIFGTGFGQFAPQGVDGLTRMALPVTASIGGAPATVTYAGAVPGSTPGLQQVNLLIPAGTAPGPAVPLMLTVGGISILSGVTLAVR